MRYKTFRKSLALPFVLFLLLFVLIPILFIVFYAFTDSMGYFTFDAFVNFFTSPVKVNVLLISLLIGFLNTLICLLIGFPLAYLLANPKINKNYVLVMLFVMPMWINFVLRTGALRDLLSIILSWFGTTNGDHPLFCTMVGMVLNYLPFTILPLYSTMLKLDHSQIEAAQDLGCNPFHTFTRSIIPQAMPGIVSAAMMVFMPTISMGEADKDWAVSFACPTDAEGMYMIYGRQSCDTRKLEEDASIDVGNPKFGGQEALVVLDHVFIPNEYIFLNGEYEFAGMMVERFAGYHRQSYGGCKVGVGDTLIGAAALAAEYNGVEKASAVKDKLIEMIHLNETLYCCGIACSSQGFKTKAGNYQIDLLLANVCKQNVTRFPYEIVRLAEDIAGGLVVTMPSQKDFHSDTVVGRNGETIGDICNKFFATREGVSTEDRQRILRFIENLCLGAAAVGYRTESMHGAGSPQAQRIMIARQGNLQAKKQMAKEIAGIQD